jgi:phosphinothricin acetyltransferase
VSFEMTNNECRMTKDTFPSVLIRDAVEADLPLLVEIYNEAILARMATADLDTFTVEQRRPWFAQHQPGRLPRWMGR